MRNCYRFLLLGLLIGPISSSFGSLPPLRFRTLSPSDGLPHSVVNHVMQDSKGFMWFSTHGGLSRYDGYEFQTFVPQDDSTSVLYYEVKSTLEDAHQNIWVRYSAGGLSRYDMVTGAFTHYPSSTEPGHIAGDAAPSQNRANTVFTDQQKRSWFRTTQGLSRYVDSTDRFVSYRHQEGDTTSLPHDHVNYLAQDSQQRIWVATDQGLGLFREETQTFRQYHAEDSGLGHDRVLCVYEDAQHYLWVGTQRGLSRSQRPITQAPPTNFITYRPVAEDPHRTNTIFQIVPDCNGNLWLATEQGVVKAEPSVDGQLNFSTYLDEPAYLDVTGAHHIADIHQDSQGRVWARARPDKQGLFVYDPKTDAFVSLADESPDNLPTNAISCFYEDKSGILWFGAWRTGVVQLDLYAQPFQHYRSEEGVTNDTYAIHRRDSLLWVGTSNGLYQHHLPSGTIEKLPYDGQRPQSGDPKIVGAIAYDSLLHSLWLGYYDYKVSRRSLQDRTMVNYHYYNNQTDRYRPWSVRTICPDPTGRVWVGAVTGGLHYYDRTADRFHEYPLPDSTIRWINNLSLQQDSLLWISTMQRGLHRLNLRSGQVVSLVNGTRGGLPTNNVSGVASVGQRTWVGTAQGLVELDANDRIVATYTTASGLCSNDIKSVVPDRRGRLWISTSHGLSCFDPDQQSFSNYYQQDGLMSNEFNLGAFFRDEAGMIYLGSSQGVVAFDPDRIRSVSAPLAVHIVDVRVNNAPVSPGDTVRGQIPFRRTPLFTRQIVLPYRANNVMLQFAALNFRSPMASRYDYRLRGFDEQWVTTGANHRRAAYTNLAPGTYFFQVRDHGQTAATTLEITVLPPWWGTVWFRLLVLLVIIVIVVGWNRWRHGELLRQRETLQRVVTARTASLRHQSEALQTANQALQQKQQEVVEQNQLIKQMADEVHRNDQRKIRFFTQMSHEFRTPLTLILGPLQLGLASWQVPRSVKHQLGLMKRNAERLFTLIDQLIDLNRVEEGAERLRVAEFDVIEKTQQVAEAFQAIAYQTEVSFDYQLAPARYWGWLDSDKYDKMLYNLLSNAFKFTPSGGNVQLSTEVVSTPQGDFLRVVVQDSGVGIPPEAQDKIFDHFYTTAASSPHQQPGSGIGLALVKQLVSVHRGEIQVASENQTTTFQLTLPVSQHYFEADEVGQPARPSAWQPPSPRPVVPPAPVAIDPASPSAAQAKVLVVDDHPDMCAFVRSVLAPDYQVTEAYDGQMALEQLNDVTPDLIISDVMMPRMDGIELCKRLKAQATTSHIPVVLLTAKVAQENEIAGLGVGACDYIRKPFQVGVLTLKVDNILATYRQVQRHVREGNVHQVNPSALHPNDQAFLVQMTELVDQHLSESTLNAEFLARQLSVSKSHLYKKVKALSGVSVHIFIRNHRIRAAAAQLQEGKQISEVAYGLGFNSVSYFTRCFTDFHRQPPRAYQSQLLS